MISMGIIKYAGSSGIIPIHFFDECKIDGLTKKEIIKKYPPQKKGEYYLDKFERHLKSLGLEFKEYCKANLFIEWPKSPRFKEEVGYRFCGQGVVLSTFRRGEVNKDNCPAFKAGCDKASGERLGENNPMHGKQPWNKGKDKRNPIIKALSESKKGKKASEETKKKQSESARARVVHGHTGHKHSKKTKLKLIKLLTSLPHENYYKVSFFYFFKLTLDPVGSITSRILFPP